MHTSEGENGKSKQKFYAIKKPQVFYLKLLKRTSFAEAKKLYSFCLRLCLNMTPPFFSFCNKCDGIRDFYSADIGFTTVKGEYVAVSIFENESAVFAV